MIGHLREGRETLFYAVLFQFLLSRLLPAHHSDKVVIEGLVRGGAEARMISLSSLRH